MRFLRRLIDQFKRDFETDAMVVPSRWKRYTCYAMAALSIPVLVCATRSDHYEILPAIALLLLFAPIAWFWRKMYDYIWQQQENRK